MQAVEWREARIAEVDVLEYLMAQIHTESRYFQAKRNYFPDGWGDLYLSNQVNISDFMEGAIARGVWNTYRPGVLHSVSTK